MRVAYWLRDRGFEAYAVRGGVLDFLGRARPTAAGRQRERRRARLTLAALHDKRFRRFAVGVLVSQIGSWVEWAAFGYVALQLGGSVAALGVIGFLSTIPNLILGLPAGPLTDRFDARKLVLALQTANMALSALLAVLFATGSLTIAEMGVLAVLGGSLGTLAFPAFHAMLATTVPREDLESAVAINSLLLQCARFIGPAIAGVLLATAGPTWVFVVNAASFLGVIVAVALLPIPGARSTQAREALGKAITTGFRYVLGSRSISSMLALTVLTGLFAVAPLQFMLPALVRFTLRAGPGTLGALTSIIGLGSLLGAGLLLGLSARPNKGEPIVVAYLVTALALVVVGVSKSGALWLALAVTGLTRTVLAGLSTVTVVASTSDEMRARALAIWAVASAGAVPIGGLLTAELASCSESAGRSSSTASPSASAACSSSRGAPRRAGWDARRCRSPASPAQTRRGWPNNPSAANTSSPPRRCARDPARHLPTSPRLMTTTRQGFQGHSDRRRRSQGRPDGTRALRRRRACRRRGCHHPPSSA